MKYILRNVRGITLDDTRPLISNTDILIENGIIKKIGKNTDKKIKTFDMSAKFIMPGIINAHMHFYSTLGRGFSPSGAPVDFVDVLKKFWWKIDKNLTEKDLYYSVLFPILEGIKSGVTLIFDHHVSGNIDGSLNKIAEIMEGFHIKGGLSFEVSSREGKGIFKKQVKENLEFYNKNMNSKNIVGLFGMHAGFTLDDNDLKYIRENIPPEIPIHCHVAEARSDAVDAAKRGYRGAVHRLNKFGLIRKNSLLIHGVWISKEELNILKRNSAFLIHNPSSNLNNAVGILDLEKASGNGNIVGIGTDGMHNIPLREWQLAYFLTHFKTGSPSAFFAGSLKILKNNSHIAAELLDSKIGIIKEGYRADLAFFDYQLPTDLNKDNYLAHLIFGIPHTRVTDTISDGKFLMKDYELCFDVDMEEISRKSREASKKLWKRIQG